MVSLLAFSEKVYFFRLLLYYVEANPHAFFPTSFWIDFSGALKEINESRLSVLKSHS